MRGNELTIFSRLEGLWPTFLTLVATGADFCKPKDMFELDVVVQFGLLFLSQAAALFSGD